MDLLLDSRSRRQRSAGMSTVFIVAGVLFMGLIVIGLLAAILLPAIGVSHPASKKMLNGANLRGIHEAMFIYANANREWLPGMDSKGNVIDPSTTDRFFVLLDGEYFDSEYPINPVDNKTPWVPSGNPNNPTPVTLDNISYALQEIQTDGARQKNWKANLSSRSLVGGDRNTGANTHDQVQSIWSQTPGQWQGSMVWMDNHVEFVNTHEVPTQIGMDVEIDNVFDAESPDDAWLIFEDAAWPTPGTP